MYMYNSIQNDKTIKNDLQKITQKTKDRAKRTPLKTRVEPKCSGRIISSWTTSGTYRVTPVTNTVMRHERGKDREVLTSRGTYPWSFVIQIFRNGQQSHGGDRTTFEAMISTCSGK